MGVILGLGPVVFTYGSLTLPYSYEYSTIPAGVLCGPYSYTESNFSWITVSSVDDNQMSFTIAPSATESIGTYSTTLRIGL